MRGGGGERLPDKSGRGVISAEDEHTAAEGGDTGEIAGSDNGGGQQWGRGSVDNRKRNEFSDHGYTEASQKQTGTPATSTAQLAQRGDLGAGAARDQGAVRAVLRRALQPQDAVEASAEDPGHRLRDVCRQRKCSFVLLAERPPCFSRVAAIMNFRRELFLLEMRNVSFRVFCRNYRGSPCPACALTRLQSVCWSRRKHKLLLFLNNVVPGLHRRQGITRHRVDEKVDTEAQEDLPGAPDHPRHHAGDLLPWRAFPQHAHQRKASSARERRK